MPWLVQTTLSFLPQERSGANHAAFLRDDPRGRMRGTHDEHPELLAAWVADVAAFTSNLHASAAYRAELTRVGVRRAIRSIQGVAR